MRSLCSLKSKVDNTDPFLNCNDMIVKGSQRDSFVILMYTLCIIRPVPIEGTKTHKEVVTNYGEGVYKTGGGGGGAGEVYHYENAGRKNFRHAERGTEKVLGCFFRGSLKF